MISWGANVNVMENPNKISPLYLASKYGHNHIVDELGMISHKKSPITIFGHKNEIKNFIKKFDIFHEKISMAFGFWFIFEIKLLILK